MSTARAEKRGLYNLENVVLPAQQEQTTPHVAQHPQPPTPQAQDLDTPVQIAPGATKVPTFLGILDNVSKISRQRAVTQCLNSVTGGNRRPWNAYPGHNKLITLDMDINGTREARQFHSTPRENTEIEDWLAWRLQPENEVAGRRSSKARLKLLLVTLTGGESVSSTATEDASVLRRVFDEWSFPTAALSVLLDRRATFMDQHTAMNTSKKTGKRSATHTNRVFCIGMRQWCMVWSPSPYDPPFGARGVILCMDKTWASSVPGVIQQYLKSMWMFLGFQGVLPLIACMTSLRYAASALAEDDKEAFQREFELRSWLKGGFKAERKDLGYTSAQVSWLSSRVSRHRDRLMVTNRMLGILKEDLDIYEVFAPTDSFEILRNCICNLADIKEHLRSQARQLEAQANVQLAALFNLITQKDSATALLIAQTSQSIAADSRKDQKVSVDIANSSRLIAYNTLRDSASMKAIANVTMVFLPGTFMASVFAMPFFSSQKAVGLFVNTKIWIYVVITIPLTLATLAFAWIWYRFSARSHRRLQGEEGEDIPLRLKGEGLWVDINPAHVPIPFPAENAVGRLAYARDEAMLRDSPELDADLEEQDYNSDNFEHWDPMTREFAPSVFAASSFAFTEDSGSEKSIRSKVATNRSPAATGKPAEDVGSGKVEVISREGITRSASKNSRIAGENKARGLEKQYLNSPSKEPSLAGREQRDSRRRAYVESDDSELEVLEVLARTTPPSSRRPNTERRSARRASPADPTPTRSGGTPSARQPVSKPNTPTGGFSVRHTETPATARDRSQYAQSMTRSYSDGAKAEVSTTIRQSTNPVRYTREESPQERSFPPRLQKVEAGDVDHVRPRMARFGTRSLERLDRSPDRPSEGSKRPQSSRTVERKDPERGRDPYQSSRPRSGSGDSFRSRGSARSHKGYSY